MTFAIFYVACISLTWFILITLPTGRRRRRSVRFRIDKHKQKQQQEQSKVCLIACAYIPTHLVNAREIRDTTHSKD